MLRISNNGFDMENYNFPSQDWLSLGTLKNGERTPLTDQAGETSPTADFAPGMPLISGLLLRDNTKKEWDVSWTIPPYIRRSSLDKETEIFP